MSGAYLGLKPPGDTANGANTGTTSESSTKTIAATAAPNITPPTHNAASSPANSNTPGTGSIPVSPPSTAARQPSVAPQTPALPDNNNPALKASLLSAVTTDPQNAAEAQMMAGYFGLPVEVVERNIGQLRKQYKIQETQRQLADRPALTQQMMDRGFAAQAINDVPGLGRQEDAIRNYGKYRRVQSDTNDDISAAFKNVAKGAISQGTGLLRAIPTILNSATVTNNVDAYQRIIARDPSYVWQLQQTSNGPVLAVQDHHTGGRLGVATRYYAPGSDLYEFALHFTPAQRQAALAADLKKLDPTQAYLYRLGEKGDQLAKDAFPTTEAQDNGTFTGVLPRIFGATLPSLVISMATAGLGDIPLAVAAGTTANTIIGTANGADNAYHEAIAHHADQAAALKAADAGAAIAGAVNSVPGLGVIESRIGQAIKPLEARIGKTATDIAQRFLPTITTGAAQSAAQSIGETAVARHLYDRDRSWTQGLAGHTAPAILAGAISRVWHRASGVTSEPTTPLDRLLIELGRASAEPSPIAGAAAHRPETTPEEVTDSATHQPATATIDAHNRASVPTADAGFASTTDFSVDGVSAAPVVKDPARTAATVSARRSEDTHPSTAEARPTFETRHDDEGTAPRASAKVPTAIKSSVDDAIGADAEHAATSVHTEDETTASSQPIDAAVTSAHEPGSSEHESASPETRAVSSTPANQTSPGTAETQLPSLQEIDKAGQHARDLQDVLFNAAQANLDRSRADIYAASRDAAIRYHNAPDVIFSARVFRDYSQHWDVGSRLVTQLPSIQAQLEEALAKNGIVRIPLSKLMEVIHDKHDALLLPFLARESPDSLSVSEMMARHYEAERAAKKSGTKDPPGLIKTFAQTNVEGNNIIGTNTQVRDNPDPRVKTSVEESVLERNLDLGKLTPNSDMKNAHAEMEVLHKLAEADLAKGRQLKLNVLGRYVCNYCIDDVAEAAENAEFNAIRLTNLDQKGRFRVYVWRPGYEKLNEISRRR